MILASRIVLALLGALGAVNAGRTFDLVTTSIRLLTRTPCLASSSSSPFAVGWMVGGLAGKGLARGFKRVERAAQARSAGELTVGAIGLLVGLLVSALLYLPVHALPYIGVWVMLPMLLVLGYLFAFTAAKKHRGILRLVGVHSLGDGDADLETAPRSTLVDTSAIIDGRIADIVRTGFLDGELVVPEFVLKELQQVADSADPLKRARGRRGLEVVQDLRADVQVATPDVDFPQVADVDAKLLKLAKERGMPILTTDFNLNRLAQIQDVQVLNVNDLANALKPAVLPGERLEVKLIREGKESGQGVGYLDDGTMVVVERARERIGETLRGAGDLGAAAAVRQDHLHADRRRKRLTLADLLETWAIVVAGGRRAPAGRRPAQGVRRPRRPRAAGPLDRAARRPPGPRRDRAGGARGLGGAGHAAGRRAGRGQGGRGRGRRRHPRRRRSRPAWPPCPTTPT